MAVNAQEISEEQWSLVTKKTADWCTFCGGWGWTFKDYLLEDQEGLPVVFWMAHYSGGLQTPTAKAISDNFPSSGQPVFFLNNDNMVVNSGNLNAKRAEFKSFIESLSGLSPFAGGGSTAVFDGEKIISKSKVKFFTNLEGGDYWLASYLVDDELIAYQQSQGNNAKHQNILLHSFHGNNYFGENVITGEVSVNQEFIVDGELDFTGDSNIPDYGDGYSIVTIIWAKVGNVYTPLNLNKQSVTTVVNGIDELKSINVAAFHLGAGQISINITSDEIINDANVHLFDINGRTISSLNSVQIIAGDNHLVLETQDLTLGTYVVVVESDLGSRSIKVSVK